MAIDPRRRVPTTFNKPKSRSTTVPSASRAVTVGTRPVRRIVPRNPAVKRRLESAFDEWQYKKRKYTGSAARPSRPSGSSRQPRKRSASVPPGTRTSTVHDQIVDRMVLLTRQYDREMNRLTRMMRKVQVRDVKAPRR